MITGLIFYAFAAFGLAYIVGHSAITVSLRERMASQRIGGIAVELLECPACFGFWTGVVSAALGAIDVSGPLMWIAWGLFTSGSNYALAKATHLI